MTSGPHNFLLARLPSLSSSASPNIAITKSAVILDRKVQIATSSQEEIARKSMNKNPSNLGVGGGNLNRRVSALSKSQLVWGAKPEQKTKNDFVWPCLEDKWLLS